MLVSPMQMAKAISIMSQQGHIIQPHFFKQAVYDTHHPVIIYQPKTTESITISDPQYWNIVQEAMHNVTTSPEGTGYRFGRNPPYSVAAKTGTAQVFGGAAYERSRNHKISHALQDHSLFIAYAPVEKPEIAIAVVVENDVFASQVARKVLDTYFGKINHDSRNA